jgi:hypothetical protein
MRLEGCWIKSKRREEKKGEKIESLDAQKIAVTERQG